MTFKDVKADMFDSAMTSIRQQIIAAFDEYRRLFDENKLDPTSASELQRVLSREITEDELQYSLQWLSKGLYRHYG